MRQFITTNIVDPVKAPITEKALRHINSMVSEPLDALLKGTIGEAYTPNDVIIMRGCVVEILSGSVPGASTASVTEGEIYYNGEWFIVDANPALETTGSQTYVWSQVNTLQDSVQTRFSDGNDYHFLSIRKIQLIAGASGSGLANYNGATVKRKKQYKKIAIGAWNMDSTALVQINHNIPNFNPIEDTFSIYANISNDAGSTGYEFSYAGLITVTSTQVILQRTTAGEFDSTTFDDAVINRGYIYIEYGDI